MDIIFITFPKYLFYIGILLKKVGFNIFYLKTGGYSEDVDILWVNKLKEKGIVPLPLESLPHIDRPFEDVYDPEMKMFRKSQKIVPTEFISGFAKLYPKNKNIEEKLLIIVHSFFALKKSSVTSKVNIWAQGNPNRKCLLVSLSISGSFLYGLAPNVRVITVPLEIFSVTLKKIWNLAQTPYLYLINTQKSRESEVSSPVSGAGDPEESRVGYVLHQGRSYGNLFEKNVYYSSNEDSELYPENIIHFDYSGYLDPSGRLKWKDIGNHRDSWLLNMKFALAAFCRGIIHVRHFNQMPALIILTRSYVIFRSFTRKLDKFPGLKLLLVDYEVLCPKELLLASEACGIKTIAAQERFILSIKHNLNTFTILSDYLCASPFAEKCMEQSPLYCVDKYCPVGQYRSDNLLAFKACPPPEIIDIPRSQGRKIITALGFHTQMDWKNSQVDPVLNWSAHKHFLDDMIRLSTDIPGVYIILRYKDTDWISLPVFSEYIEKINSSPNIAISEDYSKPLISYELCAHSDLVIAKHTSLADECLSVGIPVLFHDYTYNTNRIIADIFDYSPTNVICCNYDEVLERSRIILDGYPNSMTGDYEYLRKAIFGNLGDGDVKGRILNYIENLLLSC